MPQIEFFKEQQPTIQRNITTDFLALINKMIIIETNFSLMGNSAGAYEYLSAILTRITGYLDEPVYKDISERLEKVKIKIYPTDLMKRVLNNNRDIYAQKQLEKIRLTAMPEIKEIERKIYKVLVQKNLLLK